MIDFFNKKKIIKINNKKKRRRRRGEEEKQNVFLKKPERFLNQYIIMNTTKKTLK